jgi:geranylgeranyl pyrophosphate synthase
VQLVLSIITPTAVASDRVLDGPTNLVWIDPWLAYLESRGVRYVKGAEIEEILCQNGRVTGVGFRQQGKRAIATGDYYIAALPVEKMAPLVSANMRAADPALGNLSALASNVEWMNGVQFYLHRNLPTAHGHVIHIDTEWALTSISQLQFWHDVPPEFFRDSEVHSVLSVDVSDWTAPGSTGRAAIDCSREEVVRETWSQLKRSMNSGEELLREEDLHSWFLDPDITNDPMRPAQLTNGEPLLVNLVDTWALRPEATTAIPNLFLASDYVRTYTDLATMEGANEAARRAVNGLLDAMDFAGSRCELWPLHEPEMLQPWRLYDAARYQAGLPWDNSLVQVAAHAMRGASPLLERARPLLEHVAPFANTAAGMLELSDRALPDVRELSAADQVEIRRFTGLSAPQAAILEPLSGASDVLGPAGFLERLSWYRDMLSDTLAEGVPTGEPQRHLYGPVRDFLARSGKGLRPALCIATARALGGRAEDALPAAAGLEMLHNGFLVHDDIEDGSDWRRGVATMHRSAGIPIALNAGDSMNALAMRLFRKTGERLGPAAAMRIFQEVDHLVVETLEGQAMELGWVRDNDLTVKTDDYFRLVLKKTAWYSFIHPLRIGALVADGEDRALDRFDRFGYLLGVAFQITDDVLNLNGNVARYGKEINGDLWEGKRTLLLTHAFGQANSADRAWISSFLARPRQRRLPREVLRLHDIIASNGSIEWAREAALAFADAAAQEFDRSAFVRAPASPDLDWLRACVDYLVQRDA